MLRELWNRLTGGSRKVTEREASPGEMSPEERRLAEDWVEDTQADEFVDTHLGGIDPGRLLPDDRPRPEDAPPRY